MGRIPSAEQANEAVAQQEDAMCMEPSPPVDRARRQMASRIAEEVDRDPEEIKAREVADSPGMHWRPRQGWGVDTPTIATLWRSP